MSNNIANSIREIGRGDNASSNQTDQQQDLDGDDDDQDQLVSDDVNTDYMDIMEFVESPEGLGLTEEISNLSLFPVQRFILKAFYNLPLNDDDKTIRIPRNWRFAQSDDPNHYYEFTEQEYMEYLYDQGRCNIDSLDQDRHELVLPIGRRSGKCVSPDTLTLTGNGIVPIGSLGDLDGDRVQSLQVEVAQEGESETARSDAFYNGEVRDTKRIETSCGYRIEGTHNHRIRVMSESGDIAWRRLDEIEKGDTLCIHRNTNLWSDETPDLTSFHQQNGGQNEFSLPDTLDEDWAKMIGLLCAGDTWDLKNRTEIKVASDPELRSTLDDLFSHLFGDYLENKNQHGVSRFVCDGSSLRSFLDDIGWTCCPDEKRIPWSILRSPKSIVTSFLSGLFEAGGSLNGSHITMSAENRAFVSDVQIVLLNLGIVSSISSDGDTCWRLSIRGNRSKRVFRDEIGFLTRRKSKIFDASLCRESEDRSGTESVPHQRDKIVRLLGPASPHGSDEKLTYSRIQDLLKLRGEVDADASVFDHFEDLLDKRYFFDRVESIEDDRSKVCDLSVPEDHQFVAGGVTNHNTFLSGIISSYEAYKLIRKRNPQKYYGLPAGDQIQICSVATRRDQAQLLYKEAKRHFTNCDFFDQYQAKSTMKFVQFQTPRDIRETGYHEDSDNADQSIKVTFYPSNSSGIRGSANIVVILDEAAFFSEKGESSASEVYKAVEPSVATFSPKPQDPNASIPESEGRIIMISSPSSKSGLFYEKYMDAKGSGAGADDILMIQAPTWEANPTISRDTFAKSHDKDPHAFSTEYGAQFSDKIQTWIDREQDLQICIDEDLKPQTMGTSRSPHYLGLDLAAKNDQTALVITEPIGDRVRMKYHEVWQAQHSWEKLNPHLDEPIVPYCYDMEGIETLNFDRIAEWVQKLCQNFYIEEGIFDQFEGISFGQTIHDMGLDQIKMKRFKPSDKRDIFKAFKTLMLQEKLELYDYVNSEYDNSDHAPYIQELLELRCERSGRRMTVQAPKTKGKHDDFTDALVRSVWLSYQRIQDGDTLDPDDPSHDRGKAGSRHHSPYRDQRIYQRRKRQSRNYTSKRDPNRGGSGGRY